MIFRGRHYRTGDPTDVSVQDGRIVSVTPAGSRPADHGDGSLMLAPGLADIHINGFRGGDFISPSVTVEDVCHTSRELLRSGVTRYGPTIVTNSKEVMVHQLRTVARACETDPLTRSMIVNLHIEGPYICPEDGPRGAHPRQFVRPPSWDEFQQLYDASEGAIRTVTLAPELPGAVDFIARLARLGINPALGHHQADRASLDAAIAAGARLCTHLGNGAHAMLPRLANYIWEQVGDDRLWASFIADGHHIPPSALRCMLRAKGLNRSILVTDATAPTGLPPGDYEFLGAAVTVHPDHRVCLRGTPYFAGSAIRMTDAIEVVVTQVGLPLADALDLAVSQPLRFLGQPAGPDRLVPGQPADLILFDWAPSTSRMTVRVSALDSEVVVNN